MQSTEVHEKKLQTDLQGGSGGRKSARWGRAEHVKFKRKAKGMEKTKWAMKVCSVGEEKGVKKEVSFHSRRQMKAADGRRLVQTTEAAPCWDCPGSAVQGSAPSPPTSTRLSHPGRTPPARCPLVLHAHTHTRVKHTQSGQRFHHLFIFSGLGEKSSWRQHFDKRDKKSLNNVFEFRFLTDSQRADEDKQHSYMLHANYAAEYWTFCMKQEGSGVGDITSEGASWTSGWILYNLVKIYSSSDVS